MRGSPQLAQSLSGERRGRAAVRSSPWSASATAARSRAAIGQAADGQGDIAPVDAALDGARASAGAQFFVSGVEEDERDAEAAIVYALETTEQRTLENQFAQSQKMQAVGQLAGGIAHDFNNVLSAIIMATDFLLNAHKPTDPSFQDIMQIKQNANRAASAGAAAAGVLAPADAAAAGARSRRRAVRSHHAAARA